MIAISIHGGRYNHELQAGITRRNLQDWVGMTGNDVASSNTQKYRVIRMNTMSTKTMPLARSMVDVGIMRAGRVSHDEICTILPPLRSILLLRRSLQSARYADSHDVDEDMMTMTAQGGHWVHAGNAGAACRAVSDNPSITLGITVASKK